VRDTLFGVVFGLAAGLLPGPLRALVIQQTLRHGPGEGIKVAAALLAVNWLADADGILGAMSLLGAAFLGYLAYESVTTDLAAHDGPANAPRSLQKGVAANLLNPHPYLFWFTVGAPTLLVGRGRTVLTSRAYVLLVRALGVMLLVFALLFLRDGLRYLGA